MRIFLQNGSMNRGVVTLGVVSIVERHFENNSRGIF